eukprot:1518141-Rhodomonas_salina.1
MRAKFAITVRFVPSLATVGRSTVHPGLIAAAAGRSANSSMSFWSQERYASVALSFCSASTSSCFD